VRQWRITAAADRTASEPLYFPSRVAALTSRVVAATPPSPIAEPHLRLLGVASARWATLAASDL
jgi:hypothetical protein